MRTGAQGSTLRHMSPPSYASALKTIDFATAVPRVEADQVRVLIADAQPSTRNGIAALLASERDITVVGTTGEVVDAVALARDLQPTVALVDLDLPGSGGLEVARRIHTRQDSAGVKVIILATREHDGDVFAALRAGASGFLRKGSKPAELAGALRAVAAGDAHLSPAATRRLIARFRAQPQPNVPSRQALVNLTAREREVMTLVARGLDNYDIAERCFISPATVKTHLNRTMRKLDARDRAQLVAMCYQLGLVAAVTSPSRR